MCIVLCTCVLTFVCRHLWAIICVYMCTRFKYTDMCRSVWTCMRTCVYTCIHLDAHAHAYVFQHVYPYAYLHVHMCNIHVHTCTCVLCAWVGMRALVADTPLHACMPPPVCMHPPCTCTHMHSHATIMCVIRRPNLHTHAI